MVTHTHASCHYQTLWFFRNLVLIVADCLHMFAKQAHNYTIITVLKSFTAGVEIRPIIHLGTNCCVHALEL